MRTRSTVLLAMVALTAVAYLPNGRLPGHPALATDAQKPPRPYMRTHDVLIRAGRIGYCPPDQDPCALPGLFRKTPPLPVHNRAHVFVKTRVRAAKVEVDLFCGKESAAWRLGPRRWVFHANRKHATRERCDGGSLNITYAQGTDFAGGQGRYTFNTKPHRH